MDVITNELQDVNTSQVVVGLAQGQCPSRYRAAWRFAKRDALDAVTVRLRSAWERDDSNLATEPLFAHFLRGHLEAMTDEALATRMLALLDLRLELHAALSSADMRRRDKLERVADLLSSVALDASGGGQSGAIGMGSHSGRAATAAVTVASRSIKSARSSRSAKRASSVRPRREVTSHVLIEGSDDEVKESVVLEEQTPSARQQLEHMGVGRADSDREDIIAASTREIELTSASSSKGARDLSISALPGTAQARTALDAWQRTVARLRGVILSSGTTTTATVTIAPAPAAGGPGAAGSAEAAALDRCLREASVLVHAHMREGCAGFLRSSGFAQCCKFYSLLSAAVGDPSFEHIRPLGKGGYGKVWCSVKRDSGAAFAVKKMRRKTIVGKKADQHILDEQRALRAVHSRFVCALHYAYQTRDSVCLVLEWLTGGTLKHHLVLRRNAKKAGGGARAKAGKRKGKGPANRYDEAKGSPRCLSSSPAAVHRGRGSILRRLRRSRP